MDNPLPGIIQWPVAPNKFTKATFFNNVAVGEYFGWLGGTTIYRKLSTTTAILLTDSINKIEFIDITREYPRYVRRIT